MKWSILILTQPSRREFLQRLLSVLSPQILDYPDVEIVITMFDRNYELGENRSRMLEAAKGEYVNFVDDDDLVPADYVSTIYLLLDGVDYVGFIGTVYFDGVYQNLAFHSLEHEDWYENSNGYFRDLSHLNPIRQELAILGNMKEHKGTCEDRYWAETLRKSGIVKTQHFIPRSMYYYYFRSTKTN